MFSFFEERPLDLNAFLAPHPAATFFMRVEGESFREAGVQSGDILIIDRSLLPRANQLVVAILNGAFTLHRFSPAYSEADCSLWGVVTYVIHRSS